MDTNLTTQICITLQLTEAEARQFLTEPTSAQDAVRAALAQHAAAHTNGHSSTGGKAIKVGRPKKSNPATTNECPHCQRAFTSAKRLANHMEKCPLDGVPEI
jgi:hypothetical protein